MKTWQIGLVSLVGVAVIYVAIVLSKSDEGPKDGPAPVALEVPPVPVKLDSAPQPASTTSRPTEEAVSKVVATLSDDDAIRRLIESYIALCEDKNMQAAETALSALMEKRSETQTLSKAMLAEAGEELTAISRVRLTCLFVLAGEEACLDALRSIVALWNRASWSQTHRDAWKAVQTKNPGTEARVALPLSDTTVLACVCAAAIHAEPRNSRGVVAALLALLRQYADEASSDADGPLYDPVLSATVSSLYNAGRAPGLSKETLRPLLLAIRANNTLSLRLHVQVAKLLAETANTVFELVDDLNDAISTVNARALLADYLKERDLTSEDWELIIAALLNRWQPHEVWSINRDALHGLGSTLFAENGKGPGLADAMLGTLAPGVLADPAALTTLSALNAVISGRNSAAFRAQGSRVVAPAIRTTNADGEQVLARILELFERNDLHATRRVMLFNDSIRIVMELALPISRRLEAAISIMNKAVSAVEANTVSNGFVDTLRNRPELEFGEAGALCNSAIAIACSLFIQSPDAALRPVHTSSMQFFVLGVARGYRLARLPRPTLDQATSISALLHFVESRFIEFGASDKPPRELPTALGEVREFKQFLQETYPSAFPK